MMEIQNKQSEKMVQQSKQSSMIEQSQMQSSTLGSLVDKIEFSKKKTKPIKKTTFSETSSISSNQSMESKEKSKLWTEEENEKFHLLLKKHGPDFQLLGKFFEKKSKNQLKNKYKEYLIKEKKRNKQQDKKLQALSLLFKEVDQKQEQN